MRKEDEFLCQLLAGMIVGVVVGSCFLLAGVMIGGC